MFISGRVVKSLFSAHAEVFPTSHRFWNASISLLRARGGISYAQSTISRQLSSSPRTRRYFRKESAKIPMASLFSAHAEVFPGRRSLLIPVFPLLRARGGISPSPPGGLKQVFSSPRTRRYFLNAKLLQPAAPLFSAHAEVFPSIAVPFLYSLTLLRARGGISIANGGRDAALFSSPPTRRYCLTSNGIYPEDSSRQS